MKREKLIEEMEELENTEELNDRIFMQPSRPTAPGGWGRDQEAQGGGGRGAGDGRVFEKPMPLGSSPKTTWIQSGRGLLLVWASWKTASGVGNLRFTASDQSIDGGERQAQIGIEEAARGAQSDNRLYCKRIESSPIPQPHTS